jgi:hypothetical protein
LSNCKEKGNSMVNIYSLLSLWGKQGSLYPQLKVHRFNGCTP